MSFPYLPKGRLTQEDIFDPRKDQVYIQLRWIYPWFLE